MNSWTFGATVAVQAAEGTGLTLNLSGQELSKVFPPTEMAIGLALWFLLSVVLNGPSLYPGFCKCHF